METLKDCWIFYKEDLKTSVREISYNCFTDSIERCFNKLPWLLNKKILDVTAEDIILAKKELLEFYVPISVYRFINLIKNLLEIAVNKKIIKENVIKNIKLPRSREKVPNVISIKDFKRILEEINKMRSVTILKEEVIIFLKLLFKTGLRHSEARALRWQDINFEDKTIRITHSMYCSSYSKFKLTDTKTLSSRRTIHIDDNLIEELKKYKLQRKYNKNNNFIFCNEEGKPRIAEFGKYHLNKAAKILGIKITTHGLRHSHASILLKNKINILLITKRLGHSSIEVTLKIYCHLIEEDEKEILDLMKDINL